MLVGDLIELGRREGVWRVIDVGLVVAGILLLGEVFGLRSWASATAPVVGAVMAFGRRSGRAKGQAQPARRSASLRWVGVGVVVVLAGWVMWQEHRVASVWVAPSVATTEKGSANPGENVAATSGAPGGSRSAAGSVGDAGVTGRGAAVSTTDGYRQTGAASTGSGYSPRGISPFAPTWPPGVDATSAMTPRSPGHWITAGTLFGGVVYQCAHPGPQVVALEVVSASATPGPMVVALHNDGGWTETRTLVGEWAADAAGEGCRVTLRTGPEQRVLGGGPLLDEAGSHTLCFDVTGQGKVVPVSLPWQLDLERLSEVEAGRQRATLNAAVTECLAAMEPGLVYEGEAMSKLQETTESLRLRFTQRDASGRTFEVVVESMTHPGWSRRFSGGVMPNRYRSGPNLIQLTSPDAERVAGAGQRTLLGHNSGTGGLTMALHPIGRRLIGEAGYFTYEFDRVAAATVWEGSGSEVDSAGGGYGRPRFEVATRADAARTEDGWSTKPAARSSGGVGSGQGSKPTGTSGTTGTSEEVGTSRARAAARSANAAGGSSAMSPSRSSGEAGTGQGMNTSATSGSAETSDARSTASAAGLPVFPTTAGVYVATDGRWVALKAVSTPATDRAAKTTGAVVAAVSAFSPSLAKIVADVPAEQLTSLALELAADGPAVPAGDLVIVAVGEPVAAGVERRSELRQLPLIEVAAAKLAPNGKRVAALIRLAPNVVTFGAARLPATIEQPRAGIAVLRCAQLRAGTYSVRSGEKVYGVTVKAE